MSLTSTPHSSWAEIYDLAYEHSFGAFYNQLTDATIEVIKTQIKAPARIVDFGAGTGRLSIPLSSLGYEVVAVEPCIEMLSQLKKKDRNDKISTICSKMEDFQGYEEFDFAICVFTVLLYLLDEESLKKSILSAYTCLKSGGSLLVDIPYKGIFSGYSSRDNTIERSVSVTSKEGDIFNYHESIKIKSNNGITCIYNEEFLIRYWNDEKVLAVLNEIGFVLEDDLSSCFSGAGSSYYIMRKAEHLEAPRLSSHKSIRERKSV